MFEYDRLQLLIISIVCICQSPKLPCPQNTINTAIVLDGIQWITLGTLDTPAAGEAAGAGGVPPEAPQPPCLSWGGHAAADGQPHLPWPVGSFGVSPYHRVGLLCSVTLPLLLEPCLLHLGAFPHPQVGFHHHQGESQPYSVPVSWPTLIYNTIQYNIIQYNTKPAVMHLTVSLACQPPITLPTCRY